MQLTNGFVLKSVIWYNKMAKRKRPITAGTIAFEVLFILSYPFIAAFSLVVTVAVWALSMPSRVLAFFGNRK